jgi:hypothetical protein
MGIVAFLITFRLVYTPYRNNLVNKEEPWNRKKFMVCHIPFLMDISKLCVTCKVGVVFDLYEPK